MGMKKIMIGVVGCALATGAFAKTAGFQASLTPDIAIHDRDTRINGVSINFVGENPQSGFAIGVVNGSRGDSLGLSLGVVNYAENYKGVQYGLVNIASGEFIGWQGGYAWLCVNYAESIIGAQTGVVNYAGKLTGVQLGVVIYAQTVHNGLQIGVVNIMPENEWFQDFPSDLAKGMVIVNWSFGGSK